MLFNGWTEQPWLFKIVSNFFKQRFNNSISYIWYILNHQCFHSTAIWFIKHIWRRGCTSLVPCVLDVPDFVDQSIAWAHGTIFCALKTSSMLNHSQVHFRKYFWIILYLYRLVGKSPSYSLIPKDPKLTEFDKTTLPWTVVAFWLFFKIYYRFSS